MYIYTEESFVLSTESESCVWGCMASLNVYCLYYVRSTER